MKFKFKIQQYQSDAVEGRMKYYFCRYKGKRI